MPAPMWYTFEERMERAGAMLAAYKTQIASETI